MFVSCDRPSMKVVALGNSMDARLLYQVVITDRYVLVLYCLRHVALVGTCVEFAILTPVLLIEICNLHRCHISVFRRRLSPCP